MQTSLQIDNFLASLIKTYIFENNTSNLTYKTYINRLKNTTNRNIGKTSTKYYNFLFYTKKTKQYIQKKNENTNAYIL